MRKLPYFAKCDKTVLIVNSFPWKMYDVGERYCWFLSNYKFAEVFIEPPLALPESAN